MCSTVPTAAVANDNVATQRNEVYTRIYIIMNNSSGNDGKLMVAMVMAMAAYDWSQEIR